MNLKSEEAMYKVERDKKMRTSSKPVAGPSSNLLIPETPDDQTSQKDAKESDLPPSEYEKMLQKLEGEVRNHIKIEQQLKLHIECIQDKLEDAIKEKD
jgi:predicted RNase H-like nuclease (RuvC/YqgF family)